MARRRLPALIGTTGSTARRCPAARRSSPRSRASRRDRRRAPCAGGRSRRRCRSAGRSVRCGPGWPIDDPEQPPATAAPLDRDGFPGERERHKIRPAVGFGDTVAAMAERRDRHRLAHFRAPRRNSRLPSPPRSATRSWPSRSTARRRQATRRCRPRPASPDAASRTMPPLPMCAAARPRIAA